jgi:hypothetical protein
MGCEETGSPAPLGEFPSRPSTYRPFSDFTSLYETARALDAWNSRKVCSTSMDIGAELRYTVGKSMNRRPSSFDWAVLTVLIAGGCLTEPSAGAATPPAESLPLGLMAHWSLDDGASNPLSVQARDVVGGADAVLTSSDPSMAWLAAGDARFEGAIRVDGADTYLGIAAGDSLDPRTNQVSLSLWVKLDSLPSQLPAGFGGIYDSAEDAYVLYLDRGNRQLRFKITDSSGAAARPGIPEDFLVTGEWLHVAAVYDGNATQGAGEARVYLNGELMDTHLGNDGSGGVGLTGVVRSGQIAGIGRDGNGAQYFLGCSVDDVGVWRRALTSEEVSYLASGQVIPNPPPPADALTIVASPGNVKALAGSYASFRVAISNGIPPITYQWRQNGADLAGATQAQLSVIAGTETAGRYTVVVRDQRGPLESSAATLTVLPLASDPAASVAQGLAALWPLDDGARQADATEVLDVVHGNVGALAALDPSIAWLSGADARFGGALQVNGADTYVGIAPSPSLDFAADQVTVAAWVKLSALPSELPEGFGGIYDSVQDNFVLYLDRGNRELRFKVTDARGQAARPGIPESELVLGEWIHVAGVYNGRASATAGEAVVYLNGVAADTHIGNDGSGGAGLTGFVRTGQSAAIGRNGTENRYFLNAVVDDLAVWSRALSPAEIAHLAAGNAVPAPAPLRLEIPSISTTQILLNWTGGQGPYQVQQRDSLSAGSWVNVGDPTDAISVGLPRQGQARFYRVVGPTQ